jgi:NitT/TauT family transport system permease protein
MSRLTRTFDFFLVILALVVLWQLMSWTVGSSALPSPFATVRRLGDMAATAVFWGHVRETASAIAIAGLITTVGGTVLGLGLGLHRLSGEVAEPLLIGFYSLPKVVLYPLILLFFGLGMSAKVGLGILNGFAPVSLFTMDAVRNINPSILRTARVFHLSPWGTMRHVLLPAALPEILTGARVGLALTIVGVLIGEIFASNRGLGFLLTTASQLNDNATVMAVTLFIVMMALALNWMIGALRPKS